ncbi:IS66 family insertion sequence element accessory protein TnpB [Ureibacillus massiliensis]|uniref:IS66 family insertion sequence element accessory protein TnpB n=1 Tax=Ureibacillus massiliensis TaxID=292806 RepID=UPI000AF6BDCF|nr:IS66 family insertion sequence element accessory protein TnpB [Ureibacillus massiliensis]
MIHDFTKVKNIYIICGRTDMRKGIDGLATLVQDTFQLDPYSDAVFLFSGWSRDRYKCLYFDRDGFALLYKLIDNGKLQWPKNEVKVQNLTQQELCWLLEGLSIAQPKAIAIAKFSKALTNGDSSKNPPIASKCLKNELLMAR